MSILRSFSDKFFARFRGRTSVQVENTLLKLHFCRTPICSVESTSAILVSIDTMFTTAVAIDTVRSARGLGAATGSKRPKRCCTTK